MRTQGRLVLLSLRMARRSLGKYVTVAVLLSVCVLVFLCVQAVSTASADSLDDSITEDLGRTGTYRIDVRAGLGVGPREQDRAVSESLAGAELQTLGKAVRLDAVPWTCREDDEGSGQPLYLVHDDLTSGPRPIGSGIAEGFSCMAGLDVSPFVAVAAGTDRHLFGEAALIDAQVFDVARALAPTAPSTTYFLVTGRNVDDTVALREAFTSALGGFAAKAGQDVDDLIDVVRLDEGSQTREAASSVRLVYGLVAWAVLLVGAVGLLLVEMANARERSWLFGLARAVGATRASIATLVLIDAALIVLAGAALTAVLAAPLSSLVSDFGRENFDTSLVLFDPAVLPQLAAGVVVVLAVGAALPARRAASQDPVDVLERR